MRYMVIGGLSLLSIVLAGSSLPGGSPASMPAHTSVAGGDDDIDTFVLTPIHLESIDAEVPAQLYGPTTNNSCKDWESRTEACYLPAHLIQKADCPKAARLLELLERHLSAMVGSWQPGSWPAAGASVTFNLKQYSSIEHLWMATRITVSERVGAFHLAAQDDPYQVLDQAASDSPAILRIEVFDGIRDAAGFPHKTQY